MALENREGYLQQIDDNVASLERLLENSIARGSTMIQNAFTDAKRNLGQMRGALAAMRAVPQAALGQEPELDQVEENDLTLLISGRGYASPAARARRITRTRRITTP